MIRIETLSELRKAWQAIVRVLSLDLSLTTRLSHDPVGAMEDLGYEVRGEAEHALRLAVGV